MYTKMISIIAPLAIMSFVPGTVKAPVKPQVQDFKYVGDIPPLGFFDPLKLSNEKNSKYLREFELQHGRVAMLATVLIPAFEKMNPETLGINYLSQMDFNSQLPFWYVMALAEFFRMKSGWVNPLGKNGTLFTLKEDFQPGNYGNFHPDRVPDRKYNSELSNGRLAMLAASHIIGYELLTGNPIF